MTGIALLGAGRMGQVHANAIVAAGARLASIYDPVTAAAEALAARTGASVARSAATAIASPEADAVVIATSSDTHVGLVIEAVESGKPVLCEKPLAADLGEARRCIATIGETAARRVFLGFNRRFDRGHAALREGVHGGAIGRLEQLTITSRDPYPPPLEYIPRSGGLFRDMTIHDFDLARYMLGEEVIEVTATGSRLVDPALMERCGDYDTVSIILKTASGKQAIITNSRRAVYGYDQRVEAFGSGGMAISENHRVNNMRLYAGDFTAQGAVLQNFFIERYAQAFAAEIDSFVDSVERGTPVEVGFEDGRLALLLAEAAIRSVAEGRTVKTSELG